MKKIKQILALTVALTALATPIVSFAATEEISQTQEQDMNVILPKTDAVVLDCTELLSNNESHKWGDYYLVGGCTYQLEVYPEDYSAMPFQVKVYGTWAEHSGYYSKLLQSQGKDGVLYRFTAPYSGYFNFTVTNQSLSQRAFFGILFTEDF